MAKQRTADTDQWQDGAYAAVRVPCREVDGVVAPHAAYDLLPRTEVKVRPPRLASDEVIPFLSRLSRDGNTRRTHAVHEGPGSTGSASAGVAARHAATD